MTRRSFNTWRMRLAGAVAAALLAAGPGCSSDPSAGYSFESTFDAGVETVSVPMFGNGTFQYGLEFELTEALVKELQTSTPWKVTSGPGAQTTLTGVITSADLVKLATNRDSGLGQEMGLRVSVDFEWKDNRSGRVLVERRSFTASETFVPAPGVRERLATGRNQVVQDLARSIVSELRSNW